MQVEVDVGVGAERPDRRERPKGRRMRSEKAASGRTHQSISSNTAEERKRLNRTAKTTHG